MFCTNCGENLNEKANFCSQCGKAARSASSAAAGTAAPEKHLLRPRDDKWIAGVCSAFSRYLNVDLALVRILWLGAVILFGTGILAYIICWLVIPREAQPSYVTTSAA